MDHSIVGNIIRFVLVNFSTILFIAALVCAALGRRQPAAERTLSWLLLLPLAGIALLLMSRPARRAKA